MGNVAVRVEGLSKLYRIGQRERYYTLRDTLTNAFTAPFRWLRNGRQPTADDGPSPRNSQSAIRHSPFLWALKDVSFEIKSGEVVGIIGRNGAGKSTLLKILSRITEPTEGYAEVNGRVRSLLEVGTGFHPELTGRENIYLNGAILGMKKAEIERKFDEIVAFAEVEKFIDTPVKHYSSGMYLRLAFSVAAHLEPEILLVDEVLAVGDAVFQKKCLGKIGDVAQHGRTVLFVSHNMGAVGLLCRKAMYIVDGKLRAFGPTAGIVADYMAELFQKRTESLEKLRLPGCGKDLRFYEIILLSGDGLNVMYGEPIRYTLRIHSGIDVKDLSVGSSIFNSSGTCVGSLFTKETFSMEANQRLSLRLTISNSNLAPGAYYAGFSVGYGGKGSARNDFDIVIGMPAFQVLPISRDGDAIAHWSSGWGDIVFNNIELAVDKD